jgi:hypothetical protein
MPKNIVVFKIDKRVDFRNHLIGIRTYKQLPASSPDFDYLKKLDKADKNKKYSVFLDKTKWFYEPKNKKFRDLLIKQTQETWNLIEKKYINKLEKIHNKKFPYKRIFGVLSTANRFGYNCFEPKKWFACNCNSPVRCADTATHELMHFTFDYYFDNELKKKFFLSDNQVWVIKESLTAILNIEFRDLRFSFDNGHNGHEKLREKISRDWEKSKNFDKVLDKICEYVKKNKLFL